MKSYLKNNKNIVVGVLVLVAVILVGGAIAVVNSTHKTVMSQESPTPEVAVVEPKISPNPLQNHEYEKKKSQKSEVTVSNNTVSPSNSRQKLSATNAFPVSAPEKNCVVSQPQDYCMAALSRIGTSQYTVHYFNNVNTTPIFGTATNVRDVNVAGATSAVAMQLHMGDNDDRQVLAVGTHDGSGYLVVSPTGAIPSDIETVAQNISVVS